jgi:hypothetical protein
MRDGGAATMLIPDSLMGSIQLSLIDFFLSLVMISGIGLILALFPLLNRLGKLSDEDLRKGH